MKVNKRIPGKVLIGIIVLTILAFIIYIINAIFQIANISSKENKTDYTLQKDQTNNEKVSIPVQYKIKIYSITYNISSNKTKEYKLDNDFVIHTKLDISNGPLLKFTVNNGEYEIEDHLMIDDEKIEDNKRVDYFKYNYYRVGEFLCFTNHNNIEGTLLYVVDMSGKIYKKIDNINGIKISKMEFKSDRIIIHTYEKNDYEFIIDENGKIDFDNPNTEN